MNTNFQADIDLTHSALNYLNASLQGRFAALNILSQLASPSFDPASIENTRAQLDRVQAWNAMLQRGRPLLSYNVTSPESPDARALFQFLEDVRAELLLLDEQIRLILPAGNWRNEPDQLKFLVACFGRYAYSRNNYVRGHIEFVKRSMEDSAQIADDLDDFLKDSNEDIQVTHALLKGCKDSAQPLPEFLDSLQHECLGLPSVFRSHAHDLSQILATYEKQYTYAHAGISDEEARQWSEQGLGPVPAGYWRAYFFLAEEAAAWLAQGCADPPTANEWRQFQFVPDEALLWSNAGFTPVEAIPWRESGHSPEKARLLANEGMAPPPPSEAEAQGKPVEQE